MVSSDAAMHAAALHVQPATGAAAIYWLIINYY